MRRLAILGLATLLAACGGGGAGGLAPAQVQGKLTAVGAQGPAASGIQVVCENDGVTVSTGSDGSFSLEVPTGEVLRLRFTDPAGGAAAPLNGCDEEDGSPDAGDLGDGVLELQPLGTGEILQIEVTLLDGQILECGVGVDGDGGLHAEGRLMPTTPGAAGLVGEVELHREGGCGALEIEIEGLEPGAGFEIEIASPEGATETPLSARAGENGVLHASLSRCVGDPLPFGVASLADLAGYLVSVRDESGRVLLMGIVPGALPELIDLAEWLDWLESLGDGGLPPFPDGLPEVPELPEGFADLTPEELADLLAELEGLLGAGFPLGGLFPR